MTDKQRITEILKAYTKKHNISASSVILEEFAEELIANDFTKVVRCKDCIRCFINPFGKESNVGVCNRKGIIGAVVQLDDFCSYGELKECENNA